MPSLNLRLEHWQLEDLRVRAREDGRSIQRFVENELFPPGARLPVPSKLDGTPLDAEKLIEETVPLLTRAVAVPPVVTRAAPKRQRRVRCEHRIPAGSFCPRCDQ